MHIYFIYSALEANNSELCSNSYISFSIIARIVWDSKETFLENIENI